jgi:hypothetical protein
LYLVILVVWIGSPVAFRLLLSPAVFKKLNPGQGFKVLQLMLPCLCLIGLMCAPAGIALTGLQLTDWTLTRVAGILSLLLLAAMGAATVWMRQVVLAQLKIAPEILNQAAAMDSPLPPDVQNQWETTRRVTIQANAVQLLFGLALLITLVIGRQP